jgi:hypothetical protein
VGLTIDETDLRGVIDSKLLNDGDAVDVIVILGDLDTEFDTVDERETIDEPLGLVETDPLLELETDPL